MNAKMLQFPRNVDSSCEAVSQESNLLKVQADALDILFAGFNHLPSVERHDDLPAITSVLGDVVARLQEAHPYHHPLYAGQMLKPPHPVARMAYGLAQRMNPNNHSLDGGRGSSEMETEAVSAIAQMFGLHEFLGHLTGGGTVANLEALWIAGQLSPGKTILASCQAHYTHRRVSSVLKLPFESVECDERARMDLTALEIRLRKGDVGTVVATLGTTAAGSVDPLPDILKLQSEYGFRLHVDAAYGGYYVLVEELDDQVRAAYAAIAQADSVVIDPHKHGWQPYGCGCVLFSDPSVARFYQHDSPYTYFSSTDLHLGEISLECSRAGASAVALWATQRMFPLEPKGHFAKELTKCRRAALRLANKISLDPRFTLVFQPDLDIVVWAPVGASASEISRLSRNILEEAAEVDVHLAMTDVPEAFRAKFPDLHWDQTTICCLRSCLIKPEHEAWLDEIWRRLTGVYDRVIT